MSTADNRRRRLALLIDRKYGTQAEFVRATGENQGEVSGLLSGKKSFGEKKARKIELESGIPSGWLDLAAGGEADLTGIPNERGVMHAEPAPSAPAYNVPLVGDNIEPGPDIKGKIPLISWVQAGNWVEVVKAFSREDAEDWVLAPRRMSGQAFALRVRGVSMEPRYRDGDVIYVDPDIRAEHGKRVIVRLDDEREATFKELVIEGDRKFLKPLNPDWPGPKLIPINGNATIVGVVVGTWVPE